MQSFEWDENKARLNRRKHGVDFDEAVRVFLDQYAVSEQERFVDGEARWQTIGRLDGGPVLLIAHTVTEDEGDGEVIRLVSARRATPLERRHYEKNCAKESGRGPKDAR